MRWINYWTAIRAIVVSVGVIVFGYGARPAFAGIGDSPLEAFFLPYDTELTGTIGAEFTTDYYKVIVPATGRLVVRLYDVDLQDTGDELHIALVRTTQNSVGTAYKTYWTYVAESRNDSETPDIIDIPDLARGIYFVKVWPEQSWGWNGVTYKIEAEFTVFPPVVKDDIGDQRKYALPIVNQLSTPCTLSGTQDVDYFECHVPYNTDLTLSLSEIGPGGNVDMEVYTAFDVMIGAAAEGGSAEELLHLSDLVPGQYFIKIFGEGTVQYTFTATQEFAQASDILDDVGGDLAHAMPLLPGNPSVFCLQPYNVDDDLFSIYQPEDGVLTVDVYNILLSDIGDDLYVQVLDEYGNPLAKSDNGSGTPEHIELHLPRGPYFVGVYGEQSWGFTGALYTIDVKTSQHDVGDAFNQAMQIHAIPYGSETYGYPYVGMIDQPGDVDFFQVLLKDAGFIYLTVDRMLYTTVDVQLFDAYHTLLQTSANPETESEEIYVDGLDAGVYFIRVYSRDNGIGQYRLTPTIGTPTSPISDDIGDDMTKAFPLVPFSRVGGHVWADNTSDYFVFGVGPGNDSVRVCVTDQIVWDQGDDIKLHIYDASGTQIGLCDNDVLEDEVVVLHAPDAGLYYARITPEASWGMSPIQYNIVVETDVAPSSSAGLYLSTEVQSVPGAIAFAPVVLDNSDPDKISSVTIGVQFDPDILEPLGVCNAGVSSQEWNAQVRYARSVNSISVSMDNFSTVQSGPLLDLVFRTKPDAAIGSVSALTVLASTVNGAIVPALDGLVTVVEGPD